MKKLVLLLLKLGELAAPDVPFRDHLPHCSSELELVSATAD